MIKPIATFLLALVFALSLTATALASDYQAAWGEGLDAEEVAARALLKQAANQICDPGDSEVEKVRKLNQYVCDQAEYDYGNAAQSLADLVYQGQAVCSGYAAALAYLLDCANIKNFMVTAFVNTADTYQSLHIWNAVYIEGEWLHVDPTWNDATRCRKNPDGKYFLLTTAAISSERQGLTLKTPEEYDRYYDLLKTAVVCFKTADPSMAANAGQEPALSALPVNQDGAPPSSAAPAAPEALMSPDGAIFVPAREAVYALGGYVRQEEDGGMTLILGSKTLLLTAGKTQGYLDGEEFIFDAAPQMVDGELMIPARAAFEKLGAVVEYDDAASEVTVFYDPHRDT